MTEFEKLVEEDQQIKNIKKQKEFKLQQLKLNAEKQTDQLRKGKPVAVLSLGKQFQNTGKDVKTQKVKAYSLQKEVEKQADREILKRKLEMQKVHPKEFKEHLQQKQKEKFLENQQLRKKQRGHGR